VLVDEAQDLSPMQWRMLRRRGPRASWTIVGDPAQSSWDDPKEIRKVIRELAPSARRREFKLTKNYRSPAEVFDLASHVIEAAFPEADLPEAVRATGVHPELLAANNINLADEVTQQVVRLAELTRGTVGVISAEKYWDELYDSLNARPELAKISWSVITPLESKGLEYDAVIVVSPDDISQGTPAGARLLYVTLTRATQRLVVMDIDTPGRWRAALR
jgi:DNA helicase IV